MPPVRCCSEEATQGPNESLQTEATVVDGDGNVNAVRIDDGPTVNNDAGQEGAAVVSLDPKKFDELIYASIAKGVEIEIAKALAIFEPGRSGFFLCNFGSSERTALIGTSNSFYRPCFIQEPSTIVSFFTLVASLPPQLPGRLGSDATAQSNPLYFMVPPPVLSLTTQVCHQ